MKAHTFAECNPLDSVRSPLFSLNFSHTVLSRNPRSSGISSTPCFKQDTPSLFPASGDWSSLTCGSTKGPSLSIVVLVIDVPLMLGAVEDPIPLSRSMNPVVRVEDPATEDSVESTLLYTEFVELDEGGDSGKIIRTSSVIQCRLSINGALKAFVANFR